MAASTHSLPDGDAAQTTAAPAPGPADVMRSPPPTRSAPFLTTERIISWGHRFEYEFAGITAGATAAFVVMLAAGEGRMQGPGCGGAEKAT